jgi:toxin ParE1/3/4
VPRLVFLSSAKTDIEDIFDRIATDSGSLTIASAYVAKIYVKFRNLAALPGPFGRPRPEFEEGLRSTPYRSHIIFFRYRANSLEVVNVLHASMDFDSYFSVVDDDTT